MLFAHNKGNFSIENEMDTGLGWLGLSNVMENVSTIKNRYANIRTYRDLYNKLANPKFLKFSEDDILLAGRKIPAEKARLRQMGQEDPHWQPREPERDLEM